MLVLARNKDKGRIVIDHAGERMEVMVTTRPGDANVYLSFDAPRTFRIVRAEVER